MSDPFDIFNSLSEPQPEPPASVFGFPPPAAHVQQHAQPTQQQQQQQQEQQQQQQQQHYQQQQQQQYSQPAASDDPFAMFAPSKPVPAPAPAPAADDPFAGFAPPKPIPAPAPAPVAAAAPAAAPAPAGWGFVPEEEEDDFFNWSPTPKTPAAAPAGKAASGSHHTTEESPTGEVDLAAMNIKDKPPPLPTEGVILARLSARSLFAKEWAEAYWVFRGYHLYIYRCLDDFKYGKQGENIKKEITINAKMRTLPIKKKEYSGFGQLHNFFLEEVEDYGANQVCKFASPELKSLDILCQQINRRIRKLKGV
jgi:type II secretory pathway pseudopilin PulG